MGYIHIEIEADQISKKPYSPCGDAYCTVRTASSTYVFISDGMGSGIKANIAANMCISRLKTLIAVGFSLKETVSKVAKTMIEAIDEKLPYAVFAIARIQSDGYATVLTYDMPEPIFLTQKYSTILQQRKYVDDRAIIAEANCFMKRNEALLLVSDGVSQAGLGVTYNEGWGMVNVNKFINTLLARHERFAIIPQAIYGKAFELSGMQNGDDITSVLAISRLGLELNILFGPPKDITMTDYVVTEFLSKRGIKIVSGATTSSIVAKHLGKKVLPDKDSPDDGITPPASKIEGIDLTTEGLVTFNQLFNILDADRDDMDDTNPVTMLYDYMMMADKINFFVGGAENPANQSITYRQKGLIPRLKVARMVAKKLEDIGKLVILKES